MPQHQPSLWPGLKWRLLGESMPRPGYRGNTGLYVSRHAPALSYTRIPQATCRVDVAPLPATRIKLRRKFTWIVPKPAARHARRDAGPGQRMAAAREPMLHLPCVGAACFVKSLRIPFHL